MSAPGLTSAIRAEGMKNLQLNAGVMLINFDYSDIADADALKAAVADKIVNGEVGVDHLGMTRGGGSFTITREVRSPEIDGRRFAYKGDKFVDSMDGFLSTTLLEVVPAVVNKVMSTSSVATSGYKKTVSFHTAIDPDTDYIPHICWVGDIADGRYVLIEIDNAFNTSDFVYTYADKNEGTLPVEYHAHQGDVLDYDELPYRIVYFDKDDQSTLASLTVASAAGTNVGGTALTVTTSATIPSNYKTVYKVGTSGQAPTITYGEHPDYTWTEWDGTSEIAVGTSANGKKATVAYLTNNGKAIAAGNATLAVKTA